MQIIILLYYFDVLNILENKKCKTAVTDII